MSSDSESFTSHSGSIENQLDTVLETKNATVLLQTASNGSQQQRQHAAQDSELPDGRDGGRDHAIGRDFDGESSSGDSEDAESADGDATTHGMDALETPEQRPPAQQQQQQQQHHQAVDQRQLPRSAENLTVDEEPEDRVAHHTTSDSWAINSPYVESTRELDLRTLSRQLCKKSARRGYDFKLMLVGESGIGKTTLIDSLFNVESTRNLGSQFVRSQRDATTTTKLCERFFELEEGGVSVRLTVIDTPGFATELDSTGCVQPVLLYVDRQLEEYFRMEQGTDRTKLQDGRVHAMIYMINPSNRGLKPLDVMCLKALHNKVNIVPVIGKSDTLTASERSSLKAAILRDISRHGISLYSLPDFDQCFGQSEQSGDDFYLRNQYESLKNSVPLAVVGSNMQIQCPDGHWSRAREYPWGIVDIENPEYSDFLKLRELLIMYMEDFKERTHEVIYEQIRLNRLRQADWQISHMSRSIADRDRLLEEKEEQLRQLRRKLESIQHESTSDTGGSSNNKSASLPIATTAATAQPLEQRGTSSSFRVQASASYSAGRSAPAGAGSSSSYYQQHAPSGGSTAGANRYVHNRGGRGVNRYSQND